MVMKRTIVSVLFAALLLPLAAFAADDDSLVEVFATGVGTTQDAAHKAADRAAVEQVVGTMVDAATLVENDELVEDKILTYSAALIADSTIVGTPKAADGLITVKVKAPVKKTALREKLVAEKLVSVELDGESLWAQMVSAQDNLADAEAMIKDVLAKHLACVVAEPVPGKTGKSPLDLDPKTGEVFANVRVRIDQAKYAQFAKEVVDKLGPMATRKRKIASKGWHKTDWKYAGDGWIDFKIPGLSESRDEKDRNYLLVMESLRSGTATVLWFDDNKMEAVRNGLDTGPIAVAVVLLDRSGIPAAEHFADISGEVSGYGPRPSVFFRANRSGAIIPFFGGEGLNFYGGARHTNFGREDCQPKTDETFRISLGTFTADELKNAGNLKIRVGHMKDGQFVE